MSASPRVQYSTVDVEEDFLPPPAVKLIVTQYLATCDDTSTCALIIVGAFYDRQDRPLWSTEILISHIEDDSGSDSGDSTSDSDTNSCHETEEGESDTCE